MTTKQEFNCVFCKDIFENKEELQEHFRKHGDPKYKNRFEIDPQASDEKSKDKADLVSCDVCAQVFPTISKAITHKHKVHPDHDAKYFCPWCGKLFTMKHLYNVHVQSNHGKQEQSESKRFHCNSCSVDFFIPSAMINHNKFFHRQDTDLPDIGQSKKVKIWEQEIIPVYYCAFCGEEYENKVNLIKHTTDDHGDENQSPDEVLKCPLCEAVFYHLDAYEFHLTFHSSEDMYSVKNPEYSDLLDYSLETVPPVIEKVVNLETEDPTQDAEEAESTLNAVGIEKFLELAMDQSEDSNPVKAKKHKKRKKSKKSAITLDEFLSMNQDVFGEGLDFQGVEEVPTRVVKKQLKNNKKTSNTMVTSAELDKLKRAGIVVKKQGNRNPIAKSITVTNSTPIKTAVNKPDYKINKVRGIETSSEVLTKLMNQSNNQIKIVKKVNPNIATNEPQQNKNVLNEEAETAPDDVNEHTTEPTQNIEVKSTLIPKLDNVTKDLPSPKSEKSQITTDNSFPNKLSKIDIKLNEDTTKTVSDNNEDTQKISEISDVHQSPKLMNYKTCDEIVSEKEPKHENVEKDESDEYNSDTELENSAIKSDSVNCVNKDSSDDHQEITDNNSNGDSEFSASASSLSTLKHLSHLTVKPVSQNKKTLSKDGCVAGASDKNSEAPSPRLSHLTVKSVNQNKKSLSIEPANGKNTEAPSPNLSHVTVKPVSQSKKSISTEPTSGDKNTETWSSHLSHLTVKPVSQNKKSLSTNKEPASDKNTESWSSHLSHLTVKPVSQNKKSLSTEPASDKNTEPQSPQNDDIESSNISIATDKASLNQPNNTIEKNPNMDALKTLGKNITIKSLSTKRNIDESEFDDDQIDTQEKITSDLKLQNDSCNRNVPIKKTKVESNEPKPNYKIMNSSNNQDKKCMPGKQPITKPAMGKITNKITVEKADNSLPTSNADILRRLTNITTKPIGNKNSCQPSTVKQASIAKKITETEEKKEEIIEIFDVDDSEDEEENNKAPPPETTQSSKSIDALKNLSKNITIKSFSQQSAQKNIKVENTLKHIKIEKEDNNSQNTFKDEPNIDTLINLQNRSDAFKNVLQGLCKNITIKSRNTSPSQFPKTEEYNSQDCKELEDNYASDSDSCPGNVKITELDEDMEHDDDNEGDSETTETLNTNFNQPIVELPNEPCRETDDEDEYEHDFETSPKVTTQQKNNQSMKSTSKSNVCFNNLKNINKSITIKSLSKSSIDNDERTKQAQICDSQETPQKKQLPTKPSNPVMKQNQSDNMSNNRISKNVDHTSAQSWNKKVCAMNQVNTVNKEVTVKTIQTKTVIQEITTTVTKTIKTVNQTMKQEVRGSFQTNTPMVQRIQGIRPTQSKNLQGVVIRHASPMVGARPSNTIAQIRPASSTVRPSNQIVPIRPSLNVARPNNPRMAVAKKALPAPSPSPNKQVIGRPLKISPTAIVATTNAKRPNTEDVSGPFSCFKKPKESLIPVSDIPSFASSGSETTAQFTSASHTSSSNFTSTTKVVKGNTVMTAKQMKSEVNATSQQLNRLSTNTGLKIMTSQQKQSQAVHEQSESSPMKRTTLEAIQRLQQQGLLVKKPRVEVNEASEDSDHADDNNVGYSSADEHDD